MGWQLSWGPCDKDLDGKPAGKRDNNGRPWPGLFLDVLSLAYALDADRGASFAEHCADFGLQPVELALAVPVDEHGAETVARAVLGVYQLALGLDEQAGQWFTSAQERREGRGQLDLARTTSPGAVAAEALERSGLRPPLAKFDLTHAELGDWAEASYGGWCQADPRLLGVPFKGVSADLSSAYPLVAHRLGWWDVLCAERLRRRAVTAALSRECERAAAHPTAALDPAIGAVRAHLGRGGT